MGRSLYPSEFAQFGDDVLFDGTDGTGDTGLWISNGTATGSFELLSGSQSGNDLFPLNFTRLGARMLFSGGDGSDNTGVWATNGTASGTTEILAGSQGGHDLEPTNFFDAGTFVLFAGNDSTGDTGLWATTGTAAGTHEIETGKQGSNSLSPSDETKLGSKVLFVGVDSGGGSGVWITDGTASGTKEIPGWRARREQSGAVGVHDLRIVGLLCGNRFQRQARSLGDQRNIGRDVGDRLRRIDESSDVHNITSIGSTVVFAGVDSSGDTGVWATNGTPVGTIEILDGSQAGHNLSPARFVWYDGRLLFEGTDSTGKVGLWITNGTAGGTRSC